MAKRKHLTRDSTNGLVCPPCGHVITDESTINQMFGDSVRCGFMCPKCYTFSNAYRIVETRYSTFIDLIQKDE
jgi:hypothetical protein